MRRLLIAAVVALLAGCGSGGGSATVPDAAPGALRVAVRTQGPSPSTVLYAVQFTLKLPAGVGVAADAATGAVTDGVLHPAVPVDLAGARYEPASGSAPGYLRVNIIASNGFGVGELATFTCSAAQGASPDAAGFTVEAFSAKDANGAVMTGVLPQFSVQTQ